MNHRFSDSLYLTPLRHFFYDALNNRLYRDLLNEFNDNVDDDTLEYFYKVVRSRVIL